MSETEKKPKLHKKTFILGTILLVFAGLFAYGFYIINRINQIPLVIVDDNEVPVRKSRPSDIGISDEALMKKETGVVNFLLLGIDRRSRTEQGRSDTMIIASIDGNNRKVKLTSLMRDMYVPIPGRLDNRLNSAWAFGVAGLALKTVNQNFDLDIRHYVALDFLGFEEIVNLMEGVEVYLTSAESTIVGVNGAGRHTLSGSQVLSYTRIRRIGSDFQRTERQRSVLSLLYQQAMKTSFFDLMELLPALLPHVETNLTKMEMVRLGRDVLNFKQEIKDFRLPASGTYRHQNIRGMAVLVSDLQRNKELLHEFIYGKPQ